MQDKKLQTPNSKLQTFWNLGIGYWRLRRGFGLIELMIVITVFGIAVSVITASFLSFERNQLLKSAASTLKNDIRLVQSKALSGDKGSGGTCAATSTLVGWYLKIDTTTDPKSYTIAGDCRVSGVETTFNSKTIDLPRGVRISGVSCSLGYSDVAVFYQPLTSNVSFHNNINISAPHFFDTSGNLTNTICTGSALTITLQLDSNPSKSYRVVVIPSGEVNEQE